MARKTTYTCDRCGASKDDDTEFLARIAIQDAPRMQSWGGYVATGAKADWCRDCHIEMGTLQPWSGNTELGGGVTPNPQPTLESLIREIIRNEVPL